METRQSTHPTPQQLAAFALAKLGSDASERMQTHVATCARCAEFLSQTPRETLKSLLQQSNMPRNRADQATPANQSERDTHPGLAKPPQSKLPQAKLLQARPLPAKPTTGSPMPQPVSTPVDTGAADTIPLPLRQQTKYRIVRLLGRGGMGSVYEVYHERMGRRQALKVINPELVNNPQALLRFDQEVQAVAKLDHPNIARAYDAESFGALQVIVMEFVPGQTLDEVLKRRGRLSVTEACRYVRQACLGLQHAHERGLVHRDLKPQNLMLAEESGTVKILDFGLAKIVSENKHSRGLTMTNMTMGTYEFSAPEQALDAARADIRADIYGLGCTIYYLIAGVLPFNYNSDAQLLLAHQNERPRPLRELCPGIPTELSDLVDRMLAKNPADRPQMPAEVANALLPFAQGESAASAAQAGTLAATPAVDPAMDELFAEVRQSSRQSGAKTKLQASTGRSRSRAPFAKIGALGPHIGAAGRSLLCGMAVVPCGLDRLLRRLVGEENHILRYFLWGALPLLCGAAVWAGIWASSSPPPTAKGQKTTVWPGEGTSATVPVSAAEPAKDDPTNGARLADSNPPTTGAIAAATPRDDPQVQPQAAKPVPEQASPDQEHQIKPVADMHEAGNTTTEPAKEASSVEQSAQSDNPSEAAVSPAPTARKLPTIASEPRRTRPAREIPRNSRAGVQKPDNEGNSVDDQGESVLKAKRFEHTKWTVRIGKKVTVTKDKPTTVSGFNSSSVQTIHHPYQSTTTVYTSEQIEGELVSYKGNDVTISRNRGFGFSLQQKSSTRNANKQDSANNDTYKFGNFSIDDQKFLKEYRTLEKQYTGK